MTLPSAPSGEPMISRGQSVGVGDEGSSGGSDTLAIFVPPTSIPTACVTRERTATRVESRPSSLYSLVSSSPVGDLNGLSGRAT